MPTPSERQDAAHRAAERAFERGFNRVEGSPAANPSPEAVQAAVERHRRRIDATNRETADAGTEM